jgi:Uma2 family endonuclease
MSTAPAQKTKRIKLTRSSNGMLMTPEEFDAVIDYDDRFVYELIHGVLIVNPFSGASERDANDELGFLLRDYQNNHPLGEILDQTIYGQYIPLPDGRRWADRAIWAGLGRVPNTQTDMPTIVVEFISKRKRDRVRDYEEKRREYEAIGVREHWVIDRFARTMTVFKNKAGTSSEVVVKAEGSYQTPLLPGFVLPLGRLLKVADKWAAAGTGPSRTQ